MSIEDHIHQSHIITKVIIISDTPKLGNLDYMRNMNSNSKHTSG